MNFKHSVTISLIAHIAILGILTANLRSCGSSDSPQESGQAKEGQESINVEIAPKESDVSKNTMESVDLNKGLEEKKEKTQKECGKDKWFGGIGVVVTQLTAGISILTTVYPGYPAHEAGLKRGETLYYSESIRGEVGSTFVVTVLGNDNKKRTVMITRGKICTE